MSEFTVDPELFAGHAARLGAISGALADTLASVAAGREAAAGTSADAGLSEGAEYLASVLPAFGQASDRLHAALLAAAGAYSSADASIARAALPRRES